MNILLTNDDGISAKGIKVLEKTLRNLKQNVFIIVPDRERSAISQAITLNAPIRMWKIKKNTYIIDGTPADCVYLAMLGAVNFKPDIVVSGINKGPNMSEDVVYSGTVAAAIEAAIWYIPSFAISIDGTKGKIYFETAGKIAQIIIKNLLKHKLPPRTFLNVNVPNLPFEKIKGIKITKLGSRRYEESLIKREDPQGNPYFWIGGEKVVWKEEKGTDYYEVKNGYVSITPLHLDFTDYKFMKKLKKWRWNGD